MASHLMILSPSARTAKIPTTPGKYLTEVRNEACNKFNLKPDLYTLKFNNKPVTLSQQIRLANLPGGARLDLVQASRSPAPISVALQLPESEKNVRLTQKFPNNDSLWKILRQFESGSDANHNFTQRGVPEMNGIPGSGSGRLNHETPVITVMPGHRELSTFVELQQTLSQLGFDSGTALLRLNFKNSGTPLEEAMTEITEYFKTAEEPSASTPTASGSTAEATGLPPSVPAPQEKEPEVADSTPATDVQNVAPEPMEVDQTAATTGPDEATSQAEPNPATSPSSEPLQPSPSTEIKIFAPPSSSTPQAALRAYNEADYIPTIEHAKAHQASLQNRGKNSRLLSDKELAEQDAIRKQKSEAQKGVTFRIRLPDESQVMMTFSNSDTASKLYESVRNLLVHPTQPFHLRYIGPKGAPLAMKNGPQRLVQDLRFSGREILTFLWDDNASSEARASKNVLKQEWQQKAQVLRVEEPEIDNRQEEKPSTNILGMRKTGGGSTSNADKESKLKSIFSKGFYKK
ncbi:uncharacterized protein BDZ99DRAFT_443178 [Mytilinidion resinicola]|uniref:UBX domain-containing protein n=1 Tax=Mytilinidion resinicola TaxID=574789 RepID=A0A6A6YNI1_9PEZI|nr:uncharacterized protein BDZ99DRAFT_443178 [Mytilinidion resinicola]KAF2810422.1 hypothetical protein BDZ99DRAFT_443178 [Mytilinidion resinicola]